MLQAKELTKTYGDHLALDRLNLEIPAGEVFCLLGPNGAGKTTTINLFLSFIKPDSGQVFVDGKEVDKAPLEARRAVAYIPERVSFYDRLTGVENLAYFCELAGKKLSATDQFAVLNRVGLTQAVAKKQVHTYSKGMRQKIAVAIAIARQAKAMLLDEPTSGLDPQASNALSDLLLEMKDSGVAVLMATHDLFRARETGDRVGIMRQGKLIEERRTAELSAQELEASYLKCIQPEASKAS